MQQAKKRQATKRSRGKPNEGTAFTTEKPGETRPPVDAGEIVETGYGVAMFPIRAGQKWSEARLLALARHNVWLTPADRMRGLIVGFANSLHSSNSPALPDFIAALATRPSTELYIGEVSEQRQGIPVPRSQRERADWRLASVAASIYEEIVRSFLEVATGAAFDSALVAAMAYVSDQEESAAAAQIADPFGRLPRVRKIQPDEQTALRKRYESQIRAAITEVFVDIPGLVHRAGRRPESERDHHAYCMRERLVHSPSSELAALHLNARRSEAKRRVIEVLGSYSDSSWSRIMKNGRIEHERVSPGTRFCCDT